ncbi:GDSL-type esterase/lipase family protein [Bacteroidia bacterium]|nr:GDSL-type esterase/lipase family protein [Bacteroidia bacterium]MDC1395445.1 GDSL-type esterase/lipase family protein [Bacteroidia bacterium]
MTKYLLVFISFIVSSFTDVSEAEILQNIIVNPSALTTFYNSLEKSDKGTCSIVHIGDSHIQANFLTGSIRNSFQNKFGNAGRGFVFPYRIAQSRGALDIDISYSGNWQYCNVMRNADVCNLGVAGFSVTSSPTSRFALNVANKAEMNSSFNKIKFFDANGSFQPTNVDGSYILQKENDRTVIYFDKLQDSLELKPVIKKNTMPELQGMVLENGHSGILYHSMGVNGSGTIQYLRSIGFENQIKELDASLVVVSFGTNDCYVPSSKFCVNCVKDRYRTIIARLRSANPQASILLTTPPDHYFMRKYPNINVSKLRDALYELSREENVALWDLYYVMGGENSIINWRDKKLASRDLVHFTKEGYQKQGDMFFEALMGEYPAH